jgi:hypothetical protein
MTFIKQPEFPLALQQFIYKQNHPKSHHQNSIDKSFDGPIHIFHSAKVRFYMPSDLCGTSGMYCEMIYANYDPNGSSQFDTIFVAIGNDEDAIGGLLVAHVRLLFSYFDPYSGKDVPCALVTWFIHTDDAPKCNKVTDMWKVCPE